MENTKRVTNVQTRRFQLTDYGPLGQVAGPVTTAEGEGVVMALVVVVVPEFTPASIWQGRATCPTLGGVISRRWLWLGV